MRLLISLAAVYSLYTDSLAEQSPGIRDGESHEDYSYRIMECVMNVDQAALYLGQAGILIDGAVADCPSASLGTSEDKSSCSAMISGVVASVGWATTYLANAASGCAKTMNHKAICASDIAWVVTSLASIAAAASGIASDCTSNSLASTPFRSRRLLARPRHSAVAAVSHRHNLSTLLPDFTMAYPAFLEAQKHQAELRQTLQTGTLTKARQGDIALCVIHVNMVATYIVRAVKQIRDSVIDCPSDKTEAGKKQCAVDVTNVISSFMWVASFLSYAVSDCMDGDDMNAVCTGDVTDLIAEVSSLAGSSIAVGPDCQEPPGPVTDDLGSSDRTLSGDEFRANREAKLPVHLAEAAPVAPELPTMVSDNINDYTAQGLDHSGDVGQAALLWKILPLKRQGHFEGALVVVVAAVCGALISTACVLRRGQLSFITRLTRSDGHSSLPEELVDANAEDEDALSAMHLTHGDKHRARTEGIHDISGVDHGVLLAGAHEIP